MKSDKTIITIIAVLVAILIVLIVIFVVREITDRNLEKLVLISLWDYNKSPAEEKVIEITDKKDIKKLRKMYKELGEPDEELNLALDDDVIIKFENGDEIRIQIGEEEYCYVQKSGEEKIKLMLLTSELVEYVKGIVEQ